MQNATKKSNKSLNSGISKADKAASKAINILSVDARVKQTLDGMAELMSATHALDNAKAAWDAARMGCRANIADAHKQYAKGKDWAAYLKGLRAGLVARKIVATPKAAQTLVNNQLIALKLTGNTDRAGAGGKRAGAGRPETTEAVVEQVSEKKSAARLAMIMLYVAQQQQSPSDDPDVMLGNIAKLGNGIAI